MIKKKIFKYTGNLLLVFVSVFISLIMIFNTTSYAETAYLHTGSTYYYNGTNTIYKYVGSSDAYCLDPTKNSPSQGYHTVTKITKSSSATKEKLAKMCYFADGGPGYDDLTKWMSSQGWSTSHYDFYCLMHVAMAYVKTGSWKKWGGGSISSDWQKKCKKLINWCVANCPDIWTSTSWSLDDYTKTAPWKTTTINGKTVQGYVSGVYKATISNKDNKVTFKVPAHWDVYYRSGSSGNFSKKDGGETVTLKNNYEFFFVGSKNASKINDLVLTGAMKSFQAYWMESSNQDLIYGVSGSKTTHKLNISIDKRWGQIKLKKKIVKLNGTKANETAKFEIYNTTYASYSAADRASVSGMSRYATTLTVSNGGPATSAKLTPGTYKIHQISGKSGYSFVSDKTVKVTDETVTDAGELLNNELGIKVKVIKKDKDTGTIITSSPATFQLLDSNKNVLASGNTSNGTWTASGKYSPGTYYIKETKAPSGYELMSTNPATITLAYKGDEHSSVQTFEYTAQNTQKEHHNLAFYKMVGGASGKTTDTFTYSVALTGLEASTTYNYVVGTKNSNLNSISGTSSSFTTGANETTKTLSINLKHNQEFVIKNLPTGAGFTVTEQGKFTYVPSYTVETSPGAVVKDSSTGEKDGSLTLSGTFSTTAKEYKSNKNYDVVAAFNNNSDEYFHDLEVSKIVSGDNSNVNDMFTFNVKLGNLFPNTTYSYTYGNPNSPQQGTFTTDSGGSGSWESVWQMTESDAFEGYLCTDGIDLYYDDTFYSFGSFSHTWYKWHGNSGGDWDEVTNVPNDLTESSRTKPSNVDALPSQYSERDSVDIQYIVCNGLTYALCEWISGANTDNDTEHSRLFVWRSGGSTNLSIQLKHGEVFKIKDLPTNSLFEVTEVGRGNYIPSYNVTTSSGAVVKRSDSAGKGESLTLSGTFLDTISEYAQNKSYDVVGEFNNNDEAHFHDLGVSKIVTGNMGDVNETFNYNVELTGLEPSTTYQYIVGNNTISGCNHANAVQTAMSYCLGMNTFNCNCDDCDEVQRVKICPDCGMVYVNPRTSDLQADELSCDACGESTDDWMAYSNRWISPSTFIGMTEQSWYKVIYDSANIDLDSFSGETRSFTTGANEKSKSIQISLKHNQAFVIKSLPNGAGFKVTEEGKFKYTPSYKVVTSPGAVVNFTDTADRDESLVLEGSFSTAISEYQADKDYDVVGQFTNERDEHFHDLAVYKLIVGDRFDANSEFTYNVILTGLEKSTTYEYVVGAKDDNLDAVSGRTETFSTSASSGNKTLSITMSPGQEFVIKDLPQHTKFVITEAGVDKCIPSYRVVTSPGSVTKSSDSAGEGESLKVEGRFSKDALEYASNNDYDVVTEFTNEGHIYSDLVINKAVTGKKSNRNEKFKFTVNFTNLPSNGDSGYILPGYVIYDTDKADEFNGLDDFEGIPVSSEEDSYEYVPVTSLDGRKIIVIGDTMGIPGEIIANVLTTLGYDVLWYDDENFWNSAAGAVNLQIQQRVKDAAAQWGDDLIIILGNTEGEHGAILAETFIFGDPTYAGPLTDVALHLDVCHIFEPDIHDLVGDSEVGVYGRLNRYYTTMGDWDSVIESIDEIRTSERESSSGNVSQYFDYVDDVEFESVVSSSSKSVTIMLADNQSVKFYHIPNGVNYEIVEADSDYVPSYTVTSGAESVDVTSDTGTADNEIRTSINSFNLPQDGTIAYDFTNVMPDDKYYNKVNIRKVVTTPTDESFNMMLNLQSADANTYYSIVKDGDKTYTLSSGGNNLYVRTGSTGVAGVPVKITRGDGKYKVINTDVNGEISLTTLGNWLKRQGTSVQIHMFDEPDVLASLGGNSPGEYTLNFASQTISDKDIISFKTDASGAKDGQQFSLINGENATIYGLPEGSKYAITEIANRYEPSYVVTRVNESANNSSTKLVSKTGTINRDCTTATIGKPFTTGANYRDDVEITNASDTVSLEVGKISTEENDNKDFNFTVDLTGLDVGSYWALIPGSGTLRLHQDSNGDIIITQEETSFSSLEGMPVRIIRADGNARTYYADANGKILGTNYVEWLSAGEDGDYDYVVQFAGVEKTGRYIATGGGVAPIEGGLSVRLEVDSPGSVEIDSSSYYREGETIPLHIVVTNNTQSTLEDVWITWPESSLETISVECDEFDDHIESLAPGASFDSTVMITVENVPANSIYSVPVYVSAGGTGPNGRVSGDDVISLLVISR